MTMTPAEPAASFAEIRDLIPLLPGPDLEAATDATERTVALRGEPETTARRAELWTWLASWQARRMPALDQPRICLFAGNHGVAAHGPSSGATASHVQAILAGEAAVNDLCRAADADLRVYEMALDQPTRDFTREPAMSEEECARAMAYGMMAVEPGVDLLCLGAMGDGSDEAAAALGLALFGGVATDWTGVDRAVAAGAARHAIPTDPLADPLLILRRLGGHELAAVAGAVLAARLARLPVVIDGFAATMAAAVAWALDRRGLDHCLVAQCVNGLGHARILAQLGKTALLGSGVREDPGIGCARAIPVLRKAVAVYAGA